MSPTVFSEYSYLVCSLHPSFPSFKKNKNKNTNTHSLTPHSAIAFYTLYSKQEANCLPSSNTREYYYSLVVIQPVRVRGEWFSKFWSGIPEKNIEITSVLVLATWAAAPVPGLVYSSFYAKLPLYSQLLQGLLPPKETAPPALQSPANSSSKSSTTAPRVASQVPGSYNSGHFQCAFGGSTEKPGASQTLPAAPANNIHHHPTW